MIIESKTEIKYIKLKVMIESVLCPGLQYNCGLNAMITHITRCIIIKFNQAEEKVSLNLAVIKVQIDF